MIRTAKEIADDIQYPVGVRRDLQEILREWGESIVSECGDTAFTWQETNEMNQQVDKVKQQL